MLPGYRGIANQGATCYLNSFLQALFMTPEFRRAVLEWRYEPDPEGIELPESSIPLQLQKLFCALLLSSNGAVSTTALTSSFGWESDDVYQQQDVQEMFHKMFDALEFRCGGTALADVITSAFTGRTENFFKCTECTGERAKPDLFLDLSLDVGNGITSLEQSLHAYRQPETIDGVQCPTCDRRCPTQKGARFRALPHLLALHLKRFQLDFETLQRKKISTPFHFPAFLSASAFFDANQSPADSDARQSATFPRVTISDASDAHYELYAVLMHRGTALGGHYYAYIKELGTTGRWLRFDDSRVTVAEETDLPISQGPNQPESPLFADEVKSSDSVLKNAYMLFYRRVTVQSPSLASTDSALIDSQRKAEIDAENQRFEKAMQEFLRQQRLCTVEIFRRLQLSAPSNAVKSQDTAVNELGIPIKGGKERLQFTVEKTITLAQLKRGLWGGNSPPLSVWGFNVSLSIPPPPLPPVFFFFPYSLLFPTSPISCSRQQ